MTLLAARPVEAAVPRRATLALARVEAVRLLRHPLTLAATLFLIGFWVATWFTNQANRFPVLQDIDRDTELGMMLLLGAAALIAGNLAVLRAHRDGTAGLGRVLILPAGARTAAHLLAVVPLAVLGVVLALLRVGVLWACTPAAGRPEAYEVLTGPATVLLFGALGVLLGRLTRSAVAAPLVLLALLASLVVLPLLTTGGRARWLQPVVVQGDPALPMPAPVALLGRPAGAHLGYLLGVAGLLAVAAVARAGTRTVRVGVAGGVALALAVTGGVLQLWPLDGSVRAARVAAMEHPAARQECRTLDGVTYCAFPEFSRWIPAWHDLVRAVVAQVPEARRPDRLAVRQRVVVGDLSVAGTWHADDVAAGTPDAVTASTRWGDSRSAAELAGQVAYRLITGAGPGAGAVACGGTGVLTVWLAGQAGPLAATGIRLLADPHGVSFAQADALPGVDVPAPELTVGLAALHLPAGRVRDAWATLTAPGTTAARAAALLGLPAPPAGDPGRGCR